MKSKKIKRLLLSVFCVFLAVVLCIGGYLFYRINCDKSNAVHSYSEVYAQQQITMDTAQDGSFRIMKINDTHLLNGTCDNDVKTLDGLKKALDARRCDLVIIVGDLVEGFNLDLSYDKYQAISCMAELIESYDVAWTFVPGNNDGEIDGSNEDVIAYMMQYDHFLYGNEEGVDGAMQLFIDLNYQGKTAHSIALFDSGARKPTVIGKYDYIKQSQIEWLVNGVADRDVSTSVFYHIATPDFHNAYYYGEVYGSFQMENNNGYCPVKKNTPMAEAIKGNSNITLLSCAHQHGNNMCTFYKDRYYQLSTVSGFGAGRPDYMVPACTYMTIHVNENDVKAMYEFEQINL